jgi:acetyltransferase-like isoleucine patch superfamily enzyme
MRRLFSKIIKVIAEEFAGLQFKILLLRFLNCAIPRYTGGRIRAFFLSLVGFRIGRGCMFMDMPNLIGLGNISQRLVVGDNGFFNVGCHFDLADTIIIEDGVTFGPEVMLITGAHEIGLEGRRAGPLSPKPLKICKGAWLGARCLILPGVTIGEGAVVGAGAVVTKNVPPNVIVGGVPAQVIRAV